MVYAELTISITKPLPTHSAWSGGSNSCRKLVSALSRLLVPLKFGWIVGAAAAVTADDATRGGATAARREAPATLGRRRAPLLTGSAVRTPSRATLCTAVARPTVAVTRA